MPATTYTRKHVHEAVRDILKSYTKSGIVSFEIPIREQGLDSLDMSEALFDVEERFELGRTPDEKFPKLENCTPLDIECYVNSRLFAEQEK